MMANEVFPTDPSELAKNKSTKSSLAKNVKRKLKALRRRNTDSALGAAIMRLHGTPRVSPANAAKWAESFETLLNDNNGLDIFREFLASEFSEENIEFWIACEEFKTIRTNKLVSRAQKIYSDFVAVKSPKQSENKSMALLRERSEVQSQLEENEEDIGDIMKKYKAVVQQQTVDQITMNDQLAQIEELTAERDKLRNEVHELTSRVQNYEESSVDKTVVQRLENKIRDIEARLDLETTTKHRLEVQVTRSKDQMDRLLEEKEQQVAAKTQADENTKRLQRQIRDIREEFSDVQKREQELTHKHKEAENRVVQLESDFVQNQSDLKLAFKRIADLQAALEEDLDSDEDLSDSDELEDDELDIDTFLSTHKQSPLFRRRGSLDSDTRSRITSSSSGLTDTPSSPRFANNFDISEA